MFYIKNVTVHFHNKSGYMSGKYLQKAPGIRKILFKLSGRHTLAAGMIFFLRPLTVKLSLLNHTCELE